MYRGSDSDEWDDGDVDGIKEGVFIIWRIHRVPSQSRHGRRREKLLFDREHLNKEDESTLRMIDMYNLRSERRFKGPSIF